MPRKKTTIQLQFDPCFDQAKLAELAPHLPATYGVMNRLAPWPEEDVQSFFLGNQCLEQRRSRCGCAEGGKQQRRFPDLFTDEEVARRGRLVGRGSLGFLGDEHPLVALLSHEGEEHVPGALLS